MVCRTAPVQLQIMWSRDNGLQAQADHCRLSGTEYVLTRGIDAYNVVRQTRSLQSQPVWIAGRYSYGVNQTNERTVS
jgi:hypothetical protein